MRTPPPATEGPLLAWLLESLQPMGRTSIKKLLRDGRIAVNGTATTQFDHLLQAGDRVTVMSSRPARAVTILQAAGVTIVYEDDQLIAIDKPAGLLSVATESEKTDTAFTRLKAYLETRQAGRPFVVHRLDRETSGLLLFARSADTRDRLQANWDAVTKIYLAIVEGCPQPTEGVVRNFLTEGKDLRVRASTGFRPGAKEAISHYRVIATRGKYSRVEVRIETGRKHQIRVHLAGLGCPIIGDTGYGATTSPVQRLGLHAWRLAFEHPATGVRVDLESKLPEVLDRIA
ncbi:MAG TPA: RluA family pseudouridine synthase [Gemmataceae bacterium]|jgi:23S rRNA pseudouridine1911/1915/1917 synthase|nr:RluA family pseudouridine synthase [Gemmataceae bacterium]